MRVLVCGGRDFKDADAVGHHLELLDDTDLLIAGGAKGADTIAERWAIDRKIPVLIFKADWDKYGKSAGPIRNIQMLEEGKPDLVIAFPGGKGTAHMVKISKEAGIRVIEVLDSPQNIV